MIEAMTRSEVRRRGAGGTARARSVAPPRRARATRRDARDDPSIDDDRIDKLGSTPPGNGGRTETRHSAGAVGQAVLRGSGVRRVRRSSGGLLRRRPPPGSEAALTVSATSWTSASEALVRPTGVFRRPISKKSPARAEAAAAGRDASREADVGDSGGGGGGDGARCPQARGWRLAQGTVRRHRLDGSRRLIAHAGLAQERALS